MTTLRDYVLDCRCPNCGTSMKPAAPPKRKSSWWSAATAFVMVLATVGAAICSFEGKWAQAAFNMGARDVPGGGRQVKRTPMRARSLKLQRAMAVYRREVATFLAEHDRCEFPLGCSEPSVVLHHQRGRFGRRLLDKRWWKASCNFHNDFAETRTGEALACGWLVRIEGVA